MSIDHFIGVVAFALIACAWFAVRESNNRSRRLAIALGGMASIGLLMVVGPGSLVPLQARLVIAKSAAENVEVMQSLRNRLGGRTRVEIVGIDDTGHAFRSSSCNTDLSQSVVWEADDASLAQTISSGRCNRFRIRQTVVVVEPSGRLARALASKPATDLFGTAPLLRAKGFPVTLLQRESDTGAESVWFAPSPYAPSAPKFNDRHRAMAYAYGIAPRLDGDQALTSVDVESTAFLGSRMRTRIPVHPWDHDSVVVGPVPLFDPATDGDGYKDSVNWFRLARGRWFPVVAQRQGVALDLAPATRKSEENRWMAMRTDHQPTTASQLLARASADSDGAIFNEGGVVFDTEVALADADAAVVLGALTPQHDKFAGEGGRVLQVRPCPKRVRTGLTLLSLDHGRAMLGQGELLQKEFIDELEKKLLETAGRDDGVRQAIADKSHASVQWNSDASCGNDSVYQARLINVPAIVHRSQDAWAQRLVFPGSLVDAACTSYRTPVAGDTADAARVREILPSSIALRAAAISKYEPELTAESRLDGVVIAFLAADIPMPDANLLPKVASQIRMTRLGNTDDVSFSTPDEDAWRTGASIADLVSRGARIVIVPITVEEALASAIGPDLKVAGVLNDPRSLSARCDELWSGVTCIMPPIKLGVSVAAAASQLAGRISKPSTSKVVGAEDIRDQRLGNTVTIYDDACAEESTDPLLSTSIIGRGHITDANLDPFSPLNWLADEENNQAGSESIAIGLGWESTPSNTGLGPSLIADALIGPSRPYGNRSTLGARSARVTVTGGLEIIAAKGLSVSTTGVPPNAVALPGAQDLSTTVLRRDSLGPGAVLQVGKGRLPIEFPPAEDRAPATSWTSLVRSTGGFVATEGELTDYHQSEWVPWLLFVVSSGLVIAAFSPWVTPWAMFSWFSRRSPAWTPLGEANSPLSLSERASIDEAGRAAGRVVARRTAGEPEGIRSFVAGDSTATITTLDLLSMTPTGAALQVPKLSPRVRIRRAMQVPKVALLWDSEVLSSGREGDFLRRQIWLIATAVAQLSVAAGARVVGGSFRTDQHDIEIAGAIDAATIRTAIRPTRLGASTVRDAPEGIALLVIISPLSTESVDSIVGHIEEIRSSGVHSLLVQVSMMPLQFPGVYLRAGRGMNAIVNRQGINEHSAAAIHDSQVAWAIDQTDSAFVCFADRTCSMETLVDELSKELGAPV